MVRLNINGKAYNVDVEPEMPLLWALRDQLGLTGTKYGCGIAQCGACTVHIDGEPVRSCVMPVSAAAGKKITTIEGLAAGRHAHRCRRRGSSTRCRSAATASPGMIMAAAALLRSKPKPTDADIDARDDQHLPLRHVPAKCAKAIHAAAKA